MKLQKIRNESGVTRRFEIWWKKEIVSGMIVLDTHRRPAYAFPISVLCRHELLNTTSFVLHFRSHHVVIEAERAEILLQSIIKQEARLLFAGRDAALKTGRKIHSVTVKPKMSFGAPTASTKSSIRFVKGNGLKIAFYKHDLLWIKLTFDHTAELGFSTKIIILEGTDLNGVFAELVTHDDYTIYEVPERHDFGGSVVTRITEQNHKHGS